MDELEVGDQLIRFDRCVTKAAYDAVAGRDAERCGRVFCLNFALQRSSVYPDEFRSMLTRLGIDVEKEDEVYEMGAEGGLRHYGGWFNFAGEVVNPGERNSEMQGNFEYLFTNSKLPEQADFGATVAAVEFVTRLPWVLADQDEPE